MEADFPPSQMMSDMSIKNDEKDARFMSWVAVLSRFDASSSFKKRTHFVHLNQIYIFQFCQAFIHIILPRFQNDSLNKQQSVLLSWILRTSEMGNRHKTCIVLIIEPINWSIILIVVYCHKPTGHLAIGLLCFFLPINWPFMWNQVFRPLGTTATVWSSIKPFVIYIWLAFNSSGHIAASCFGVFATTSFAFRVPTGVWLPTDAPPALLGLPKRHSRLVMPCQNAGLNLERFRSC